MNLRKYFNPTSIAIVGVSADPQKVGHIVAQNIINQGYKGELYFVHPTEKELLGKHVYPNLESINKPVDLVVFAVPASVVIKILPAVSKIGCSNVLIYAAGFKEMQNEEAQENERKLQKKIKEYNVTILGPNCVGFINTPKGINLTFLKDTASAGNISIISQSGALGSALVDYMNAHESIGITQFISLGNKSVIDESESLEFLLEDPHTKVIGMYLEDVSYGDRFRKTLAKVSAKKPVVILKGGTTQAGSQAALSHTGSLVGDDAIFSTICQQSGAIRVDSYSDFRLMLQIFSYERVPSSRNILVLSNAGGMGVLLTDTLIQNNLLLVTISEETIAKIKDAFSDSAKITIHNPIDLLGDASAFDYERAITSTSREKDVGAVMVLLTPQANTEIMPTAKVIADAQQKLAKGDKKFFKPIYPVFMGETSVREAQAFFETQHMASFYQYDRVPSLLSSMRDRAEILSLREPKQKQQNILFQMHENNIKTLLLENRGKPYLNQTDSLKVLEYIGLQTAQTYLVASEENLHTVVEKEGYPLVAKVSSEKVTHKTEVKGVITGLDSQQELVEAYRQLSQLSESGRECYVQKQYSGHELIIGAKRDSTFGTVVLVGLGGIYAELMHEVSQFVYPFSYDYFEWVLVRSKMKKLIEGYRNSTQIDLQALFKTANIVGSLLNEFHEIQELDINPMMVTETGLIVVDGRVIL